VLFRSFMKDIHHVIFPIPFFHNNNYIVIIPICQG
jgi:hypothetical protein